MEQIPLSKVALQEVSFTADGAYWTLKIYPAITHMIAEVSRNGTTLISGIRCFAGIKLLPYDYMSSGGFGNFIFDSEPDWENFGLNGTCKLYYLTKDEISSFDSIIEEAYKNVANNAAD